jgi:hypothetical protein
MARSAGAGARRQIPDLAHRHHGLQGYSKPN